jgi:hypothetical protein
MGLPTFHSFEDLTGNGSTTPLGVDQLGDMTVQISGTFAATATVEGSMDGVVWGAAAAAVTAPGVIQVPGTYRELRVTVSGFSSGTITSRLGGVNHRSR